MTTSLPIDRSRRPGQSAFRAPFDFYATPPEATRALLSVEPFDGSIWEPACGDGAIARVLDKAGHPVVATDLIDRGFGHGGVDFLCETRPRAKHIVTNPPYGGGLADAFIGKALTLTRETGGKVAMLLDLASLCHPARHSKFVHAPPAAIYALDELVCLPNGEVHRARLMTPGAQRFCWMIWQHGHQGPSRFWWLSTREFGRSSILTGGPS